jgi:hypothetical protein
MVGRDKKKYFVNQNKLFFIEKHHTGNKMEFRKTGYGSTIHKWRTGWGIRTKALI